MFIQWYAWRNNGSLYISFSVKWYIPRVFTLFQRSSSILQRQNSYTVNINALVSYLIHFVNFTSTIRLYSNKYFYKIGWFPTSCKMKCTQWVSWRFWRQHTLCVWLHLLQYCTFYLLRVAYIIHRDSLTQNGYETQGHSYFVQVISIFHKSWICCTGKRRCKI